MESASLQDLENERYNAFYSIATSDRKLGEGHLEIDEMVRVLFHMYTIATVKVIPLTDRIHTIKGADKDEVNMDTLVQNVNRLCIGMLHALGTDNGIDAYNAYRESEQAKTAPLKEKLTRLAEQFQKTPTEELLNEINPVKEELLDYELRLEGLENFTAQFQSVIDEKVNTQSDKSLVEIAIAQGKISA